MSFFSEPFNNKVLTAHIHSEKKLNFLARIMFLLSLRSSFSICEPKNPPCHAMVFFPFNKDVVSVGRSAFLSVVEEFHRRLSTEGTSSSSVKSRIDTNVPSSADASAPKKEESGMGLFTRWLWAAVAGLSLEYIIEFGGTGSFLLELNILVELIGCVTPSSWAARLKNAGVTSANEGEPLRLVGLGVSFSFSRRIRTVVVLVSISTL